MDSALSARIHFWRAQFFTFFKRNDRALEEFRSAAAKNPRMARAWRCIGFLYSARKEWEPAIAALREGVRLAPDDPDTRFNLGFIYHETRRLDEAIEQFEEVIRLQPTMDRAWYGIGIINFDRGDYQRAIKYLLEAARLQFFNPYAGYYLAVAFHRAGEHDKAVNEYHRIEKFDPKIAARTAHDIGIA
jgi:tetratricopeptide (TPR) repeat protein